MEFDSDFVTRIENKYVRRESNWIRKKIESNQTKTTIESNQIKKQVSQIQSETAASTELRMPMMALPSDTWCEDGRSLYSAVHCLLWSWRQRRCWDCRCRRRYSRSIGWGRVRAGFHVTGPRRGFLGASFVSTDWRGRVFWLYGPVDILSDHLYIIFLCLVSWADAPIAYPRCFLYWNFPCVIRPK